MSFGVSHLNTVDFLKIRSGWSAARDGEPPQPRYFINPEILTISDDQAVYEEGCLSVPDLYEEVERPAACRVRYLDYQGEVREEECDGLLATCLQHEIDHLEGVLFIDHLSKLKRSMMLKKLVKAKKLQEQEPA